LLRNRLSVFNQALDHQLDDFLNMRESLLLGMPPSRRSLLNESRTVGVPEVRVRLHDNLKV
jgi:hypothetical protein